MTKLPQDQESIGVRPPFWPGVVCLLASALTKVIGEAMAEAAMDSASISGSFLNAGRDLQRAANIEGTTDLVMIALGLVGIILIVRATVSRSY